MVAIMHYHPVSGEVMSELVSAKEAGFENIIVHEEELAQTNLAEFYRQIELLQFRRIKMRSNGVLLCDYKTASDLIGRGVRIFDVVFHHKEASKHDTIAGSNAYKTILQAISTAYQVSVDIDIPIIFQFTLKFDETQKLADAVTELSELYPSHFRIECEAPVDDLRAAVEAGNKQGIWVEITQHIEDPLLGRRFSP